MHILLDRKDMTAFNSPAPNIQKLDISIRDAALSWLEKLKLWHQPDVVVVYFGSRQCCSLIEGDRLAYMVDDWTLAEEIPTA